MNVYKCNDCKEDIKLKKLLDKLHNIRQNTSDPHTDNVLRCIIALGENLLKEEE